MALIVSPELFLRVEMDSLTLSLFVLLLLISDFSGHLKEEEIIFKCNLKQIQLYELEKKCYNFENVDWYNGFKLLFVPALIRFFKGYIYIIGFNGDIILGACIFLFRIILR